MRSKKWSAYVHPEGEPYPIMDSIDYKGIFTLKNEVANTLEFANPRDAVANHVDSDDVALADTLTKDALL